MATTAIASTASRQLRHQLTKNGRACSTLPLRIGSCVVVQNSTATAPTAVRRYFAADTAGLRRTKNSGRQNTTKSQSSSTSEGGGSDPHSIANDRVSSASFGQRTPGTESVASLTTEQKLSNYAMASGLLAFVSYIFYYSLASVGGVEQAKALLFGGAGEDASQVSGGEASVNPGFEEFLKEANEGRAVEEKRMKDEQKARREANELAELESSTAARLKAQGMDDAAVAGSASDEEEREMARVAGFVEEGEAAVVGQKRPLWKRVVFFWRRE
ncbi:hypothetical protein ACHAWU_003407 [Discostella pseudostelligera]|uniref:Uncharacterized protein n=1 Tax=Discostella pseudostelligera TaxID=259834 RepID=A0ABD3MRM4_9STRA